MDDAAKSRELTVFCEGPFEVRPDVFLMGSHHPLAEPTDHIAIWTATLDALRKNSQAYQTTLDPAEKERMMRFRFEKDQERFLLGHGLLRMVLGMYLKRAPERVAFERGRYGKPFIKGHPIQFNMSDTKDAIAIAVSNERPLGVDIETTTRHVNHVEVGAHYFTPAEIGSIEDAPDGKRRFLELWTRKEAVLKASGVGIMDDLHLLRVNAPVNKLMITHPEFVAMAAKEYHVRTWTVGDNQLISLAVDGEVGEVRVFGV